MLRIAIHIASVLDDFVRRVQRFIVFATSVCVVAMICVTVFLRYVLQTDLYGIQEIVIFVGVWLFFVGASYASQEGEQITADVIPQYLRDPVYRDALRLITSGISLTVVALMTWWAYDWFAFGLQRVSRSPVYDIPMTVMHTAVLVSFFLIMVFTLRDTVKVALQLSGHVHARWRP